jgi:hypothetical protein
MMHKPSQPDYALENLLDYDGRVHWLENGYFLKFEIRRVDPDQRQPHGIRYSLTLHDSGGQRILGFDNAHAVKPAGKFKKRTAAADHWHRTAHDKGVPYDFVDVETLLDDFFGNVERILTERGVSMEVVRVEERSTE